MNDKFREAYKVHLEDYGDDLHEVNGMRRELISQLKTMINFLDKKELKQIDRGILDVIGSQVNRWVSNNDMESAWGEPIERDDDYQGEDDDYRGETDQEKYGYPGDR